MINLYFLNIFQLLFFSSHTIEVVESVIGYKLAKAILRNTRDLGPLCDSSSESILSSDSDSSEY